MSTPFTYDNLGNLTSKAEKNYSYTGCNAGQRNAGPHAVCQVEGGALFTYDGNGNVTGGNGRTVEYNPANKGRSRNRGPLGVFGAVAI